MFRAINDLYDIDRELLHEEIEKAIKATWVKHESYVDDEGIWYPCEEYTPEWMETNYKLVISKEIFIEAYNKWIKGE